MIGALGALITIGAIAAAAITGSPWATSGAILIGIIYCAWLTGMVSLVIALGRHVLDGMGRAIAAAIGALAPMLVLLLFGFYTEEIWRVFAAMPAWRHTAILALFGALALGTVWATLARERHDLTTIPNPADLQELAAQAGIAAASAPPPPPPLSTAARRNIVVTLIAAIMLRVIVVALIVSATLIAIGITTLSSSTMDAWSSVRSEGIWPLIHVSVMLGAFAGLSFAVVAGADPAARAQLVGDETLRIRRAIALWAYWRIPG